MEGAWGRARATTPKIRSRRNRSTPRVQDAGRPGREVMHFTITDSDDDPGEQNDNQPHHHQQHQQQHIVRHQGESSSGSGLTREEREQRTDKQQATQMHNCQMLNAKSSAPRRSSMQTSTYECYSHNEKHVYMREQRKCSGPVRCTTRWTASTLTRKRRSKKVQRNTQRQVEGAGRDKPVGELFHNCHMHRASMTKDTEADDRERRLQHAQEEAECRMHVG